MLYNKIKGNNLAEVAAIVTNAEFPIDTPIKNDWTALHVVASEGTVECLQIVLQEETDINRRDSAGRTALHLACYAGNHKVIEALLKVPGIIRDARTNGGNSPLMLAVSSGEIFSLVACLNGGCNPFLENGLRETASTMAK